MDLGINLASQSFQTASGAYAYVLPTQSDVDYFAAEGFSVIRLPISWESLQPTLNGALDPTYLAQIQSVVSYATAAGLKVDLDLHNQGAYDGNLVGSAQVPTSAFADLWGKLAGTFATNSNVLFGLMNEPGQASASDWLPSVNAAIGAIRAAGATSQEVLVSGVGFDNATYWTTDGNSTVLGAPGAIVDPSNNYAFEVHQYLDAYGAGQSASVVSTTIGVQNLQAVTAWAQATGNKLFLGETGVAVGQEQATALNNMLSYMQQNSNVWQTATYWAAGQGWNNYMYSVEPALGLIDMPQLSTLLPYGDASTTTTTLANGNIEVNTYVDGRSNPNLIDIYDASHNLLAASLFDAAGNLDRTLAIAADGTRTVALYNGNSSASEVDTYDTSNALLTKTTPDGNGGTIVALYNGAAAASAFDYYNAAGALTTTQITNADGTHTFSNYTNGVLTSTAIYDPSFNYIQTNGFYADGALATISTNDAAGDHIIKTYADSQASGALTSALASQVGAASTGAAQLTATAVYNNNWQLTSQTNLQANGTFLEQDYAPGTRTLVTSEVYSSTMTLAQQTNYDAQGLATSSVTNAADGSHAVATYATHGSQTPSTVTTYDAAWKQISIHDYDAAGTLTSDYEYNPNGTVTETDYAASNPGHATLSTTYDGSWNLLTQTSYETDGKITSTRNDGTDGSHTIANYATPGSQTPSTVTTYDAAWKQISINDYDAAGTLTSNYEYNANGTVTEADYVAGNPAHASLSTTYDGSWNVLNQTSYDADGKITSTRNDAANGFHTIATYDTHGSQTPSTITTYDASWATTEIQRFNTAGALLSDDIVSPTGALQPFTASTAVTSSNQHPAA